MKKVHSDNPKKDVFGVLAGKGKESEYLPIISFNPPEDVIINFTNTTYLQKRVHVGFLVPYDDLKLTGTEIWWRFIAILHNDTAGETTYLRLYNPTDGEVVPESELSYTGTNYPIIDSGWFQYTPPSSPVRIRGEGKVSGGTGTTQFSTVIIALKLV